VAFRGHINCGIVGGKTETINEFILVENQREQFKEELQKTDGLLQRLEKAIELLRAKLASLKYVQATPELEEQKKLFGSQLSTCENNKEQLTAKHKNLIKLIDIMPDREDMVKIRQLSPILKLSVFGFTKEYKQELIDLKISWKNGALKMNAM
jgi:phage shock protein A